MIIQKSLCALATLVAMGTANYAAAGGTKTTFAPENSKRFSILSDSSSSTMTEQDFNSILDKVQAYYTSVVQNRGGTFQINRLWTNNTANASAQQMGGMWLINMYGGLARHPKMTIDGFMAVACHETGHHMGGAPKIDNSGWASNEGEADYFSTLQCMKNVLAKEDNISFVKTITVDPVAQSRCSHVYTTQSEEALCERISMAGYVLGNVLADLKGTGSVSFTTPDTSTVDQTNDDHPAAQCRLDTYFAGALCSVASNAPLSETDATQGTCSQGDGHDFGARPLCWFNPKSSTTVSSGAKTGAIHY